MLRKTSAAQSSVFLLLRDLIYRLVPFHASKGSIHLAPVCILVLRLHLFLITTEEWKQEKAKCDFMSRAENITQGTREGREASEQTKGGEIIIFVRR